MKLLLHIDTEALQKGASNLPCDENIQERYIIILSSLMAPYVKIDLGRHGLESMLNCHQLGSVALTYDRFH